MNISPCRSQLFCSLFIGIVIFIMYFHCKYTVVTNSKPIFPSVFKAHSSVLNYFLRTELPHLKKKISMDLSHDPGFIIKRLLKGVRNQQHSEISWGQKHQAFNTHTPLIH